jgi:hypothetical protein
MRNSSDAGAAMPSVKRILLGIPGLNTFQEVLYALNYGLRFEPDGIIIVWVRTGTPTRSRSKR